MKRQSSKRGEPTHLKIRGARTHNLQGINLDIPRNQLVVVTGVSGSGKSSLAFDTIYAEGQRRYVESLSSFARQFLERLPPPDVDSIEGLSPALAIEQRSVGRNPRSTIATATEVHDHLRLLFARLAVPHCPSCDARLSGQSVESMVQACLALGGDALVMAPLRKQARGTHQALFESLRRDGYSRVRVDGDVQRLDDLNALDGRKKYDVELVVDRLKLAPRNRARLDGSVEDALARSGGTLVVLVGEKEHLFSRDRSCEDCGLSLPDFEPRNFSFNSAEGACRECSGLGVRASFEETLLVPDSQLSLHDGAIAPWRGQADWYRAVLRSVCAHYGADLETPWAKLPQKLRKVVLKGSGQTEIAVELSGSEGGYRYKRPFEGVIPSLERKMAETNSERVRDQLAEFTVSKPCTVCEGSRLKGSARAARFAGHRMPELYRMSVAEAAQALAKLELSDFERKVAQAPLTEVRKKLGFLREVGLDYLSLDRAMNTLSGGESQRIRLATQLGRSLAGVLYVLDEPSIGLHARDRERLIGALKELRDRGNTVLVVEHDEGTMWAADWLIDLGPGAGVHGGRVVSAGAPQMVAADTKSLTGAYLRGERRVASDQPKGLKFNAKLGESPNAPVDFELNSGQTGGPKSGANSGLKSDVKSGANYASESDVKSGANSGLKSDVKSGANYASKSVAKTGGKFGAKSASKTGVNSGGKSAANSASKTGANSSAKYASIIGAKSVANSGGKSGRQLKLRGARGNNLKNVDVDFPLGKLIGVSGVSGSGKSTLVRDTLFNALSRRLNKARCLPAPHKKLVGVELVEQVVLVDQSPIGRSPRSNPATYTKVFQPIRELFAELPEAKVRGYGPGRFSFNVAGGRCEACEGDGQTRIQMHFLPDVFVECESCRGRRYRAETLEIRYQGLSIADVLRRSVSEALELFAAVPSISRRLRTLEEVGLGYLALGQSATTLSGGEAQRIKLARELGRRAVANTVTFLDEPTTGLHFEDIRALLGVLRRLVDQGNTVIVIEHDLDVLASADWLIDLGPEGGSEGGWIVAQGPPEEVAASEGHTASFLRPKLKPRKKKKSALAPS